MEQFTWDNNFETGLTEVDEQHHRLVALINRFGELLLRPQQVQANSVSKVLEELARYAQHHFSEEEELMARFCLDPLHLQPHTRQHADFLLEVQRQAANLGGSVDAAAVRLHEFLVNWLAYHILGVDRKMARQIAAIEQGAAPREALLAVQGNQDPATAMLVRAMERLFQQVSDRNQALFELNRTLEQRVEQRTRELSEANLRLEGLASTDALTGLANRRTAMSTLHRLWKEPESVPLACIMIDADGFKGVNDRHGHDAGDQVLLALARCLSETVRNDDTLCRLGGDEFLVICAQTPMAGVLRLAEYLRSQVSGLRVAVGSSEWCGSISAGVAARSPGMSGPDELLKAADKGLYEAKRHGRNCVATAPVPA